MNKNDGIIRSVNVGFCDNCKVHRDYNDPQGRRGKLWLCKECRDIEGTGGRIDARDMYSLRRLGFQQGVG